MSEVVDRGVIALHSYPITVELRVLPHIPTASFTKIIPPWEAQIIFDLARAFDIDCPPPGELTYDEALEVRGEIFQAIGERFSEYAELGESEEDRLIRKYVEDEKYDEVQQQ